MIYSEILPPERWGEVEPYFRERFNDAMPATPAQATFPALFEGSELVGFFHVEHLLHFNSLVIMPQYRNQGLALRLAREAVARIPPGHSGLWLNPAEHGRRFAEHLGFRRLGEFTAYRKDV